MYIVLDKADERAIAEVVSKHEKRCEDKFGRSTTYIEIGDIELTISFTKVVDGYIEDETNSWVCTKTNVCIHDVSFNDVAIDYDREYIERYAEELILQ